MKEKTELWSRTLDAHLKFQKNEEKFLELMNSVIDKQCLLMESLNGAVELIKKNQIMYHESHNSFLKLNLNNQNDDIAVNDEKVSVQNKIVENKNNISIDSGAQDMIKTIVAAASLITGYPEELIFMDMSIKDDLDLDSIKMVELYTNIIKQLPELDVSNISVTSIRTLKDIHNMLVNMDKKNE
jgi:hypothetical protein